MYDQCTVAFLKDGGADVEAVHLAYQGIYGSAQMVVLKPATTSPPRSHAGWTRRCIKLAGKPMQEGGDRRIHPLGRVNLRKVAKVR